MGISGIGFSSEYYCREALRKRFIRDNGGQEGLTETKGTFVENPAERNIEKTAGRPQDGNPGKEPGGAVFLFGK